MKLAQALVLRADTQKKLASLRQRIGNSAVVQEGNQPPEDPNELLKEGFGVLNELRELIGKINAANAANKLPDGRTLTKAIAQRDELAQQPAAAPQSFAVCPRVELFIHACERVNSSAALIFGCQPALTPYTRRP